MKLNEYQYAALKTAIYPPHYEVIYPALKLSGEAGEVAEKVGKALRDDDGHISAELRMDLLKELGDVLWYIAVLAADVGFSLEDVAATNIRKLADRQKRGVLGGSGDNR